jgi:ureidoacrylate peracid hydrolase
MEIIGRPALVVIDMQNGFCAPEGFMARIGLDVSAGAAIVPAINRLIGIARAANVPIFYTRYSLNEDYSDAGLMLESFPAIEGTGGMVRGSWDAALLSDIAPLDDEVVIDKTRQSAFVGTDLEERLRSLGVESLIFCGVTTNMCVESSVRDAYARDLRVTVVSDASAAPSPELHQAALTSFVYGFGPDPIATVDEIEGALAAAAR